MRRANGGFHGGSNRAQRGCPDSCHPASTITRRRSSVRRAIFDGVQRPDQRIAAAVSPGTARSDTRELVGIGYSGSERRAGSTKETVHSPAPAASWMTGAVIASRSLVGCWITGAVIANGSAPWFAPEMYSKSGRNAALPACSAEPDVTTSATTQGAYSRSSTTPRDFRTRYSCCSVTLVPTRRRTRQFRREYPVYARRRGRPVSAFLHRAGGAEVDSRSWSRTRGSIRFDEAPETCPPKFVHGRLSDWARIDETILYPGEARFVAEG